MRSLGTMDVSFLFRSVDLTDVVFCDEAAERNDALCVENQFLFLWWQVERFNVKQVGVLPGETFELCCYLDGVHAFVVGRFLLADEPLEVRQAEIFPALLHS